MVKRKKRKPFPQVSEYPPGPRRVFRKTISQLSHEYKQRLDELGVPADLYSITSALTQEQREYDLIQLFVDLWRNNDVKRGIEIVPG